MFQFRSILFFLIGMTIFQTAGHSTELTTGQKTARIPALMVRGILDFVSTPLEIIRTPIVESKEHPRLWPVTFIPRAFTNMGYRVSSSAYDILFYPFAAPFVDTTPPLKEKMGLADDIWQLEDEY